jgi:hypothetical protein
MSAEQPPQQQPEDPPLNNSEKPPRAKRVLSEAQLENLKKARDKALASRHDKKLLKEREDLLKKEALEARWEALHEEEERIKTLRKAPSSKKPENKKKPKSKIIHVSPPLSSEESSPDPSSDSSEEFVPKASRRAHRLEKTQVAVTQPEEQPSSQPQIILQSQAPSQDEQLRRALRALGLGG